MISQLLHSMARHPWTRSPVLSVSATSAPSVVWFELHIKFRGRRGLFSTLNFFCLFLSIVLRTPAWTHLVLPCFAGQRSLIQLHLVNTERSKLREVIGRYPKMYQGKLPWRGYAIFVPYRAEDIILCILRKKIMSLWSKLESRVILCTL